MDLLIIDDEYRIRKALIEQIGKLFPGTFRIWEAESVEQGLSKIRESEPSIVLLDIQMKDGTGFDLLESLLSKNFELIFTTAYSEYALDAFDHKAGSYLLKPVSSKKLSVALERALENIRNTASLSMVNKISESPGNGNNFRFRIPVSAGIRFIKGGDIIYIKAEGAYFKVFFENGEKPLLVSKTLRFFESQMDEDSFMRVHKSYIVNLDKIKTYSRVGGGTLIMDSDHEIPVSAMYRKILMQKVGASA